MTLVLFRPESVQFQGFTPHKKVIFTTFVRHMDDMRNTIKDAFYRFTKKLSFAASWIDKFLATCFNYKGKLREDIWWGIEIVNNWGQDEGTNLISGPVTSSMEERLKFPQFRKKGEKWPCEAFFGSM